MPLEASRNGAASFKKKGRRSGFYDPLRTLRETADILIFLFRDPMCAVFPTEVSCTIPNVGAAGGNQVCPFVQGSIGIRQRPIN